MQREVAPGYAEEAEELVKRYESLTFAEVHRHVLHLVPTHPARALDIGSGTGRDAAALAEMGHRILAVEPTDALRMRAIALHPSPNIEWVKDSLPDIASVCARGETFDLVMMTAVWMHLDAPQRRQGMPRVADLVAAGGTLIMTLRHGPVPEGRRMFEVTADETIALAGAQGLRNLLSMRSPSVYPANKDVAWTRLAFAKV
jgi:protein-L-isoaspartate O-methyltransferase